MFHRYSAFPVRGRHGLHRIPWSKRTVVEPKCSCFGHYLRSWFPVLRARAIGREIGTILMSFLMADSCSKGRSPESKQLALGPIPWAVPARTWAPPGVLPAARPVNTALVGYCEKGRCGHLRMLCILLPDRSHFPIMFVLECGRGKQQVPIRSLYSVNRPPPNLVFCLPWFGLSVAPPCPKVKHLFVFVGIIFARMPESVTARAPHPASMMYLGRPFPFGGQPQTLVLS